MPLIERIPLMELFLYYVMLGSSRLTKTVRARYTDENTGNKSKATLRSRRKFYQSLEVTAVCSS